MVSGTMAAVVPIEVPRSSGVSGMIATTRMMNGVDARHLRSAPARCSGPAPTAVRPGAGGQKDAQRRADQRARTVDMATI